MKIGTLEFRDLQWQDFIGLAEQIAIVLAAILIAWCLHWLAVRMLKRVDATSHPEFSRFRDHLLPHIYHASKWVILGILLELALPFLTIPAHALSRLHHLLYAFIIACSGWLMMGVTQATSEWLKQQYSWDGAKDNLKFRSISTQLRVFTHVAIFIIWLLTAIAIIMTIPHLRNIGISLFASAGVSGIVIGMAASPTLSNLIAGIQLALTQPIRIDDQVVIEGVSGVVEEIDSTYVVVRLWDFTRLIVPLNYFIQNRFQNLTHTSSNSTIVTVNFYVDVTTRIEPLRHELERIAKAMPLWDGKLCKLGVTNIKDNKMIEIQASISTENAANIFITQCRLREKLVAFIQQPARA